MRRTLYFWMLFAIVFSLLPSCRRSLYKVNVIGVEVNIEVKRLERDLFEMNPSHITDSINFLEKKYDGFLRYFGYVINIGEIGDSAWKAGLVRFCTDKDNFEVYSTVIKAFPGVEGIEAGIKDAFRHYSHYFPGKKIPGVYTCITGFNNSIITGDSVLGIGLDRYLGNANNFYSKLGLYKYQIARMKPENILPDCMYGWGSSEWDFKSAKYTQDNVLADIIHEGKILYFVKCMLPSVPDELIFGFTADQLKFCRKNEGLIWQYLVEHNLLFSSDQLTRKKLTGDAPFTAYFSSESPGRAAAWTGFRIVESYMLRNRAVTLERLMVETDIQKILQYSGYRPAAGHQE